MPNEIINARASQGNHDSGWVVRVEGEMMVYSGGTVEVEDLADGFNPTIALFRVTAKEAGGPMKGVPVPFKRDRRTEAFQYKTGATESGGTKRGNSRYLPRKDD